MAAPIAGTPASTAYNSATSPKTATVTATAGDVLVAVAVCADSNGSDPNLGISGGGLTWTLVRQVLVTGNTNVAVWKATAATSGSVAVSFTMAGNPSAWFGGTVIPFSNATGIGSSSFGNDVASAPSLSLATTADHSAIVMAMGDWNAISGASRSYLTLAGAVTEDLYFNNTAQYTAYVAHHPDVTPQGTPTVGLSAPTGQKWAMVAVEVLGGAGLGPTHSDAPTGTRAATGSITESWSVAPTYNDLPSGAATAAASITESRATTEAPTGAITATGSIVESWETPGNLTDAPSGAATATGSLVASHAYSDVAPGAVAATGTVTESSGVSIGVPSSSTAPRANAVPSSTVVIAYTDTPSGVVTATGSIVESLTLPTVFADAPSGTATAAGSIVESSVHDDVFPDVATVIDTFDRADGAIYAGAGGAIWDTNPIVTGSPVVNVASNATSVATGGAECVTLAQFGPDVDFYWTIADAATIDASHYLAAFFAFQPSDGAWPDSGYSGYALIGGLTATANEWSLFRYTGGAGSNIGSFGVQAVAIGDSVGISMRGSTITAHYKPAAGSWTTIGTITDATYNRAGYLGFEFGSVGIDNLGGGTHAAVGPPTYNDATPGTATAAGTSGESFTATDAPSGAGLAAGSRIEGYARADTPTGAATATGSIAESWGFSTGDTPVGAAVATGSVEESLRVNVTPIGAALPAGSCNETLDFDSVPFGRANASSSADDALTAEDAPVAAFVAFGSRVESWGRGQFDSPTGIAASAGLVVESHLHAALQRGTQAADGTASDIASASDTPSATATATGSIVEFGTASSTDTSPAGHVLHRTAPIVRNPRSSGEIRRNR